MQEAPYQNREIREMVDDVRNSLQRIEIQTTITNGKVAELQKWRYIMMGAVSVLTTLVLPVVFIVIQTYFK